MKRIVSGIFTFIPFLFITFFLSNVFSLSFISFFSISENTVVTIGIHVVCFVLAFLWLRRYTIYLQPSTFSVFSFLLCIPCLIILLMRFPLLYPTFDDLAFHIPVGDMGNTLWANRNFMPLGQGTFYYPALQQLYTPFLYVLGIRLTIFLNFVFLSVWFVSLHARYRSLMKQDISKLLLDVLFLVVLCTPWLMGTHGTLMVDFAALLFSIEALYQFVRKDGSSTFAALLVVMSVLVKQSTAIFFIPIFIYFLYLNRKRIHWVPVLIFGGISSVYFVRLFLETGNPFFDLLNGFFKSPLYLFTNSIDKRWGPQTLLEVVQWPIIGQLGDRYGEVVVGKPAKLVFFLVPVVGYVGSLVLFLWKRKIVFLIAFCCFFFWSFLSGYSRYLIPLNMLVLLLCIREIDTWTVKLPKSFKTLTYAIFGIGMLICFVSLKTDYSWRPYPSLATPGANKFFLEEYKKGLYYIGKDTIPNFTSELLPLIGGYDGIIQISKGPSTFISYIATRQGIPVVSGMDMGKYKTIQNSSKISERMKNNLNQTESWRKILVVVDDVNYPDQMKNLFIAKNYTCQKPMNAPEIDAFQRGDFFGRVLLISCSAKPI